MNDSSSVENAIRMSIITLQSFLILTDNILYYTYEIIILVKQTNKKKKPTNSNLFAKVCTYTGAFIIDTLLFLYLLQMNAFIFFAADTNIDKKHVCCHNLSRTSNICCEYISTHHYYVLIEIGNITQAISTVELFIT